MMDAFTAIETGFASFCGSEFWNASLTWEGDWPEFTECFQQTALPWLPCAWLLVVAPLYIRHLYRSPYCPIAVSAFNTTKTIISMVLAVVALMDMLYSISQYATGKSPALVYTITPAIQTFTFVICSILIQMERSRGYVTSGVLFFFMLLLVICGVIPCYTKIIHALNDGVSDLYRFVSFYIYFCLGLIELVLMCIADSAPPIPEYSLPDHCPEISASFLSRVSFHWVTGLVVRGYRKTLTEADLFRLNPRDTCAANAHKVYNLWQERSRLYKDRTLSTATSVEQFPTYVINSDAEPLLTMTNGANNTETTATAAALPQVSSKSGKEPSLTRVLIRCFGWDCVMAQLCKLVADVCVFIFPLLLQQLIRFTTDESVQLWKGFLYAAGFFFISIIQSVLFNQLFQISMTMGMRMKSALISAIYRKSLTICKSATKDSTGGEIVNLMSVDAQRIQDVATYIWLIWSSPLQIIVCVVLLYRVIGWAALPGVAVLVLMLPLNALVAHLIEKAQVSQMELKDNRIKVMWEMLNGMKLLKFYTWELSFIERVNIIRGNELKKLFRINIVNGLLMFIWTCAPFAVMIAMFTTFVLSSSDHVLTSEIAFVSISLFNIMKIPMTFLPMMIVFAVTAKVSVTRISKFLKHNDLDPDNVQFYDQPGDQPSPDQTSPSVKIINGTFSWDQEPCLKNIDITIPRGSLTAIVGHVGSGKSSLLAAMLGELEKTTGRVEVSGHPAYVSQQAWIQNATLRDNILFGKPYDHEKYQNIVRACAMEQDLQMLPAGDMTEIGERGINLSGGQKQRVSLARAVYQDLDVYMLDDPLSAVDAHVGKHIFQNLLGQDGLLRNKTRILVTHGVHWLPRMDSIVVMVQGEVSEEGTYQELLSRQGAFSTFLRTYFSQHRDDAEVDTEDEDDKQLDELKQKVLRDYDSSPETTEAAVKRQVSAEEMILKRKDSKKDDEDSKQEQKQEDKLMEEEEVEIGTVNWRVYWHYIKALHPLLVLVYAIVLVTSYGVTVLSNVWISKWTDDPFMSNATVDTNSSEYINKRNYYLETYGGIGIAEGVLVMGYSVIFAVATVRASKAMHAKMLQRIMRAPLSFFDTTPIGRIINRFSRDIDTIDSILPDTLQMNVMDPLMMVLGTIVVISYSTPLFLVAVAVLSVFYLLVQRVYIPTSRQLNRLESKTRSPIYHHFSETLNGTSTIRAFKRQNAFIKILQRKVDENLSFHFALISSNRWMGLRLEVMGSLCVVSAAILAVTGRGWLTGGLVGLSITYALEITESLNSIVRGACELETNIVAVERVDEYADIPTEAPWDVESTRPVAEWPAEGAVEFQNYCTRYRPGLDLVLQHLKFHIQSKEKIGIVGRTGAGKSSMTLSLFRIIEPAGGRIYIDGVDIATLGLHQLRSKLTILPQEPVLFSGSLRSNLDPFDKFTDSEMWQALEHAHMSQFINDKAEGLEYECGEGGQNMSVGQRQLICLARTLLHKTRILIFDEATAAIDLETDHLIQETIRNEFSDCTILTIAHRLNTIMDSDRVMVLQNGRVLEFDAPVVLLNNKNSAFYAMAKDAGLTS